VTEDLTIDFAHLEAQAKATGAKVLLLSHMRGHVCDMEALMALCDRLGLRVIEDCAHTMGAKWKGVPRVGMGRWAAIRRRPTST
jgi:dTDP-4-amino-4,6-dideoxygalactose transaminase